MIPKLTKFRGKPRWVIDDRGRNGCGRRFYGQDKQEALDAYRAHVLGLSGIQFSDRDRFAKRMATESGIDLLAAVEYYKAHTPTGIRKKLGEAVQECLDDKEKRKCRPEYLKILRLNLAQFVLALDKDKICEDIGPLEIDKFLHSHDWASYTINAVRMKISAFFTWAMERGYCGVNPVKKVKTHTVERTVPKIFTVPQVETLLYKADELCPELLPYLTLGLFCGIRPDELKRLAQEPQTNVLSFVRVTNGAAVIEIPARISKTRDRRIVEISTNALAWLRHSGKPLLFNIEKRQSLCKKAEIKWSHDVMRHTFASYHLGKHNSAPKTAHELGHREDTDMLFAHYAATVTPEDADRFWKIEPPMNLTVVKEAVAA